MKRRVTGLMLVGLGGFAVMAAVPASADPGDAVQDGGNTANFCYKMATGNYVPPPLTGIPAVDRAVGCTLDVANYPSRAAYEATH